MTGAQTMRARSTESAGLYVHLPFCVVKCGYCDFYSLAGQDDLAAAYTEAVAREIAEFPGRALWRPRIATIYLGGGTPTHLPAGSVEGILRAIAAAFPVDPGAEITVEANPESASVATLASLRAAGATRISIGAQSFDPRALALMGRPHGPEAIVRAVGAARETGFENVSVDLIYGVPGQDLAAWDADLRAALALAPEHVSAYLLETDKETPLARAVASGELEEPGQETVRALYLLTERTLSAAGYARYEVSNWARPGRESRHNLGYWTDRSYVGFGASAHSYYGGRRRACRLSAAAYIQAVARGAETRTDLDDGDAPTRLSEALITALRLAAGADLDALGLAHGVDLWSKHEADLADLVRREWAVVEPPRVRLTVEGILWSLDALAPFVAAPARAVRGGPPA